MACDYCASRNAIPKQEYGLGYFSIDRYNHEIQYWNIFDIRDEYDLEFPEDPTYEQVKDYTDKYNPDDSIKVNFCPFCRDFIGETDDD
ncbi:hypothetical protein [Fructilactobacillus florum]|uniref:hypothetical protein n=1 Tax=Fructilactobacillus florum TaxID=640331 RepID=UPI0006D189D5|nr:hypothetical protein [Fructilactobacillus florum]